MNVFDSNSLASLSFKILVFKLWTPIIMIIINIDISMAITVVDLSSLCKTQFGSHKKLFDRHNRISLALCMCFCSAMSSSLNLDNSSSLHVYVCLSFFSSMNSSIIPHMTKYLFLLISISKWIKRDMMIMVAYNMLNIVLRWVCMVYVVIMLIIKWEVHVYLLFWCWIHQLLLRPLSLFAHSHDCSFLAL